MRTALRVTVAMDDSQSVELRGRGGMAMTVSARQQCWIAPPGLAVTFAEIALRRMGRANGSRECAPDDRLRETHHCLGPQLMGIAALHPSYERGTLQKRERRTRKFRSSDCLRAQSAFQTQSGHRVAFRVPRAERFRYAALLQ